MAGRYIVIATESKEDAERIMRDIQTENAVVDIVGVYFRPNSFCQCYDKASQNANNWQRGPKFGIFLCRRCRKPSQFHEKGIGARLEYGLGKNLLPAVDDEAG